LGYSQNYSPLKKFAAFQPKVFSISPFVFRRQCAEFFFYTKAKKPAIKKILSFLEHANKLLALLLLSGLQTANQIILTMSV
jgi:hypothetical protein